MKTHSLLLTLPLVFGACIGGDDDDGGGTGDTGGTDEYFRVKIDGTLWEGDTDPDHIGAVVGDVGEGLMVSLTAAQEDTQEHFTLIVPEFTGTGDFDCTQVGTVIQYTGGGDVWNCEAGMIHMELDDSGDVDVFSGTFSGTFPNPTGSMTKELTEGEYVVERLL